MKIRDYWTDERVEPKARWILRKVLKREGRDIKHCEICGTEFYRRQAKRMTIHHKDHNHNNTDPDNLQILCRKCHDKIDGREKTG